MSVRTENDSNFEKHIYDIKDVQTILGLGRSSTYDFIRSVYKNKKPFCVLKIGDNYKIPIDSFNHWLNDDDDDNNI